MATPAQNPPRDEGRRTVAVTYNAKPGDPVHTRWHGVDFEHGKAVELPEDHPALQAPVDKDGKPLKGRDGKPLPSPVEAHDWFSTANKPAKSREKTGEPDTAADYFKYAVGWMNEVRTGGALKSRWDNEAPMRERCDWSSVDQERMDEVMRPKAEAFRKAEGQAR